MTPWQWAILLEFLGQGCVFLVAKGWGLPTTDLVWGHCRHACFRTLCGRADVPQGPFRSTGQRILAERGHVCSGSAIIWGKEGYRWLQQGNCRWESPEMRCLSRIQEIFEREREREKLQAHRMLDQTVVVPPQSYLLCLLTFPCSTPLVPWESQKPVGSSNPATSPFLSELFLPEAGLN